MRLQLCGFVVVLSKGNEERNDGHLCCQCVSDRVTVCSWLAISCGVHNKAGSNLTYLPILTPYKQYINSKFDKCVHSLAYGNILLQQIEGNRPRFIRPTSSSTQKGSVMVAHTYKRRRELLGVALCNTQAEDGVETLTKTYCHSLNRCR